MNDPIFTPRSTSNNQTCKAINNVKHTNLLGYDAKSLLIITEVVQMNQNSMKVVQEQLAILGTEPIQAFLI